MFGGVEDCKGGGDEGEDDETAGAVDAAEEDFGEAYFQLDGLYSEKSKISKKKKTIIF